MKKLFFIFLLIFLIISVTENAYAYADPGVGGLLYQIVVIILSGIGLFLISLKTKLFRILRKNKKR